MFDWLKKLHGEGVARYSFILADGRQGNAKLPYIGKWDSAEAEQGVRDSLLVQFGSRVVDIEFVARTGH
jgi:hypothetical protein